MSLRLVYTKSFLKASQRLPKPQQKELAKRLAIFQQQPFSPTLHSKQLAGNLAGFFSFRVGRDWRVIFQFIDSTTIKLIDTAHRKDIYS